LLNEALKSLLPEWVPKGLAMHLLISTFGTQGDIQPFLALGAGLRAAGHRVTICTSEGYQPLVAAQGLAYAFMSNTMLEITQALLDGRGNMLALMRQMSAAMQCMLEDEWQAAQRCQPDAILYHPKMLGSYHIAEKLAIPLMMAIPLPFYTPTRAFPNPFIGTLRLRPWFNRLSYQFSALSSAMFTGMTNRFREQLGLPRQGRFANMLVRSDGTPIPVLYPYSPALLPRPDDFPAHVHVTGYWFLDRPDTWRPDQELVEYLAAGPPPIYVGFGSMGSKQGARRAGIVLEALAKTGQRGLLARGWGGMQAADLPSAIHLLDTAPHDWLFPQMAAVVHHGGAGTTAAGLRAGKPTVICPFLGDQPFWGALVHARGVGPRPIPQRRLTAERLAEAITVATTSVSMQERAAELGTKIRAEDGVATAIGIIEQSVYVSSATCAP
jgi:sterol 3beta-glucosyltransferase